MLLTTVTPTDGNTVKSTAGCNHVLSSSCYYKQIQNCCKNVINFILKDLPLAKKELPAEGCYRRNGKREEGSR